MTDRHDLLDRVGGRRITAAESVEDAEAGDDCGAYAALRGARDRAAMIDFRLRSGGREAFPYATLEGVSFDPADGVTLRFLGAVVRIQGRNLALASPAGISLLEALHRHRVPWVREVDELRGAFLPTEAVVVTRIEIERTS